MFLSNNNGIEEYSALLVERGITLCWNKNMDEIQSAGHDPNTDHFCLLSEGQFFSCCSVVSGKTQMPMFIQLSSVCQESWFPISPESNLTGLSQRQASCPRDNQRTFPGCYTVPLLGSCNSSHVCESVLEPLTHRGKKQNNEKRKLK